MICCTILKNIDLHVYALFHEKLTAELNEYISMLDKRTLRTNDNNNNNELTTTTNTTDINTTGSLP